MGRKRSRQSGPDESVQKKPKRERLNLDGWKLEDKHSRRREKNKVSARQSRQRKEDKYEECRAENKQLRIQVDDIQNERDHYMEKCFKQEKLLKSLGYIDLFKVEPISPPGKPEIEHKPALSKTSKLHDIGEPKVVRHVNAASEIASPTQQKARVNASQEHPHVDLSSIERCDNMPSDHAMEINRQVEGTTVGLGEIETFAGTKLKHWNHHLTRLSITVRVSLMAMILHMAIYQLLLVYHRYRATNTRMIRSGAQNLLRLRIVTARNFEIPFPKADGMDCWRPFDTGQTVQHWSTSLRSDKTVTCTC